MRPLRLARAIAAVACVIATGCYHWAELTTTGGGGGDYLVPLTRAAVVFATRDPALRRAMENRLVLAYPKSEASFPTLDAVAVTDSAAVRRELVARRCDVVIIVSVVVTDGRRSFVPGAVIHTAPAPAFGPEWVRVWTVAYDPARVDPKATVAIEVRIYSLADSRLIWAGRGDAGIARAVPQLASAAVKHLPTELEREGLVTQQGTALPIGPRPHRH